MIETKAELKGIVRDYQSGKLILQVEVDQVSTASIDNLHGPLRIILKKWREKRSLSANDYYWVLISAMAQMLDTSKDELHDEMLRRYGQYLLDGDRNVVVTLPARVNVGTLPGHWKFYKESRDMAFRSYIALKGTSQYDSKEMSYLLDRVIEEARELGIETATPDEIERMKMYEKKRDN